MQKTIEEFRPIIGTWCVLISDGCAFDVMEVKHKECFCPATVNAWNLRPFPAMQGRLGIL